MTMYTKILDEITSKDQYQVCTESQTSSTRDE